MTGVTDLQRVCSAGPTQRPSYVAWTLQGLLTEHRAPTRRETTWSMDGWVARIADGALKVESTGPNRDDGLRTVVAAAWAALDDDPDGSVRFDDADRALRPLA
jgi:hypothetical protein